MAEQPPRRKDEPAPREARFGDGGKLVDPAVERDAKVPTGPRQERRG